jgi:hypothetical protein
MQNIPLNDLRPLRCDVIVGTRPEAMKFAPVVKSGRAPLPKKRGFSGDLRRTPNPQEPGINI